MLVIRGRHQIKERKLGPNHPEYANTMFHLAEVCTIVFHATNLVMDTILLFFFSFTSSPSDS